MSRAVAAYGGTTTELPMADGGEGLLDVLGGPDRISTVIGPLGEPVDVGWRLSEGTAVIEMTKTDRLTRPPPASVSCCATPWNPVPVG